MPTTARRCCASAVICRGRCGRFRTLLKTKRLTTDSHRWDGFRNRQQQRQPQVLRRSCSRSAVSNSAQDDKGWGGLKKEQEQRQERGQKLNTGGSQPRVAIKHLD